MSTSDEADDLGTDSVPDAPRENVNFKENVQNDLKQPKPKESKSKNDKTLPKPPKKPPREHGMPYYSNVGASNVTYNISNANNLHIGNVVTVHVGQTNLSKTPKEKKEKEKTRKIEKLCASCDKVTEEDLDTVADHIGQNWKDVGIRLGFSQGQVDQFEVNFSSSNDVKEVIYQMLLAWKREKDSKATVGILCETLWCAKQYDAVKYLAKQK